MIQKREERLQMVKTQKGVHPFPLENFARYVSSEEVLSYPGQEFIVNGPDEVGMFFERHPLLQSKVRFNKATASTVRLEVIEGGE